MEHVTIPIVVEGAEARMEDLYLDVFDALAQALSDLAPDYAAAMASYLHDARRDGAGLSLTDELIFGFPMPGGLCMTEAAACAHWFAHLIAALEPTLRAITTPLGYRLVPRTPEDPRRFGLVDGEVVETGRDAGTPCTCLVCARLRAGELPHVTVPTPPSAPRQLTSFDRISEAMKYPELCEDLDITGQGVWRLPPDIDRMVNLTGINATDNGFSALPPALFAIPTLRWLCFENNQLDSLPDNVGQATALEALLLAGNHLRSLPASLCDLVGLKRLTLDGSRIDALPAGFERLRQLAQLDLARLGLTTLPDLASFAALERLDLSAQRCTDAIERLDLSRLASLRTLRLSDNGMRVLPALPPTLHELVASNNRLTVLPPAPALREALLQSNQLAGLPPLPDMRFLLLASNPALTALPDGMTKLEVLGIEGTAVRRLPAGMTSLRRLSVDRGQIDDAELARLENVDVTVLRR